MDLTGTEVSREAAAMVLIAILLSITLPILPVHSSGYLIRAGIGQARRTAKPTAQALSA